MDEFFKLLACIILPFAFSILIVKIAFKAYNSLKKRLNNQYKELTPFSLDASRGLAEQGYLWLSILAPVLYFFTLGYFSWQGYTISINSDGLSEFLRISTLPIALLSLSIPLSILVARIHATHQTSIQITATNVKNNMDGYYAHRKAMFEYFGTLKQITYPGDIEGDFHAHPRLHLRFFKDEGPTNGTPKVDTARFDSAIENLTAIQIHIHAALLKETPHTTAALNYADACNKIYALAGLLTLPNIYETLKSASKDYTIYDAVNLSSPNNLTFTCVGSTTKELIGSYRYIRSYLRVLCEFSGYDVSFFDKKEYLAIDKGDKYNSHPYYYLEISEILNLAQPSIHKVVTAQRKAQAQAIEQETSEK
jgi:hypothetical protein